jgi:hypothetical protein
MSVYGPDLGLANRLRQWLNPIGVQVVEIYGWQSHGRDYATFNPYGSVNHHTAGPRVGIAPSLGICINGRSGLPGPLCNVHQQRNDVVNVVAAGVANHAGRGGWQGMSGNQSVFGLEIEHCGYPDEPFDERRQDICQRIHAAFLSGLDRPDAGKLAQHFEWSTEGKIDFCRPLIPGGPEGFRFRVAQLLSKGPGAGPTPSPQRTSDMTPTHCVDLKGRHWFFIVGGDADCWASVDNSGFWVLVPRGADNKPKTAFMSGLSAICLPDGRITICGQGMDARGWQIVFKPDDPTPPWVGVIDTHPHAIKS